MKLLTPNVKRTPSSLIVIPFIIVFNRLTLALKKKI